MNFIILNTIQLQNVDNKIEKTKYITIFDDPETPTQITFEHLRSL